MSYSKESAEKEAQQIANVSGHDAIVVKTPLHNFYVMLKLMFNGSGEIVSSHKPQTNNDDKKKK